MQIILKEDFNTLSLAAADLVTGVIQAKPTAALVLATGETPLGLYRELISRQQRGEIDTSQLRIFQLDAYLGLGPDDPRSLYGWLARSFIDPLGIPAEHVVRMPGDTGDPEAVCRAYDRAVQEAGGFDLAVLGLGPNGHLGFNEPPSGPDAPTRVVTLTEASIVSNARYWGGRNRVPPEAITAGMKDLLASRQILVMVTGQRKREILARAIGGPITPDVPASYLQQHPNTTLLVDHEAWDRSLDDIRK